MSPHDESPLPAAPAPPARDILAAWEAGVAQHPIDRALTLLRLAGPDTPRGTLARLSIGERDRRLLDLREQLFGRTIDALSHCPRCREPIEFSFTTDEIRQPAPASPEPAVAERGATHSLALDEWTLDFRLPDSRDLAALVTEVGRGTTTRDEALAGLAGRCLVRGRRDGAACTVGELPAGTVAAWRQRLAEFDPQAETRLALTCPACSHAWDELFDIAAFLWIEVSTEARRLLREVDLIARTYGWSEVEILALGRTRREAYLEMIHA